MMSTTRHLEPATSVTTATGPTSRRPASVRGGRLVGLLGPALVAGVAYLDPGNVASNMTAGARFGFLLVWVVVLGNLMAWLVQYLSAKLGIVTGKSLAELLGQRITSRRGRRLYWLQAECVAMATDIAEIIGGALALSLLFNLPMVIGGVITGVVSMMILVIQGRGRHRMFERVIVSLMLIIVLGFTAGLFVNPPPAEKVINGLVPGFSGTSSVLLAASILGATVMPHAIYAHSALTRDRFRHRTSTQTTPRLIRATRWDVSIALVIAGSVNLAMLLIAATSLRGIEGTDTLDGVHRALADVLGPVVATLFAVGLLASGLASTAVGAYAGGEVMQGLLKVRISLVTRRMVTLLPALGILAVGLDPTQALVLSQVALSFGIPFVLIPLIWLTSRRNVLGDLTNRIHTTVAGILAAAALIALNGTLLYLTIA